MWLPFAHVTSRIVRGWVRRSARAIIGSAHPLEKSAPGSEYKHTLLIFVVVTYCELRLHGVLGSLHSASNTQTTQKIVHLGDTLAPIGTYATNVTDKGTL